MDLEYKHRHIKSNRMEKDTPCSANQMDDNTYVNIKVDLRTRNITKNTERHYVMIKLPI